MRAKPLANAARSLQAPVPCNAFKLPPTFLAPALLDIGSQTHFNLDRRRQFTTSPSLNGHRYRQKDNNPSRGVSAIRRTGPKRPLPMQTLLRKRQLSLPEPVEPEPAETDPNHGLWGFFPPNKEPMVAPEDDNAHGRAWTDVELSNKSWDDLHKLHWVCVKERCRIATTNGERERLKAGYGEYEASQRDDAVKTTQRRIKRVLATRWHSWNQARDLWTKGERAEDNFEEEEDLEEDKEVIQEAIAQRRNGKPSLAA